MPPPDRFTPAGTFPPRTAGATLVEGAAAREETVGMTEFPATENPKDAENIEQYGYRQELHRSLSFGDLLVYGLVFMVPIAPFGIFGGVFQGSGGMVALAYAIGMVAMMFTALS